MGFESNSISIPFHWSGGILAITIVVSIILVGTGFYIASLNWPTVMLWLKYLLIIVFFIAIIVGVGYMPTHPAAHYHIAGLLPAQAKEPPSGKSFHTDLLQHP